jgi:hypothetical protein
MKLTTVVIPAIEMTREEESCLWNGNPRPLVEGKKIEHWHASDGSTEILLEGETMYRVIVIK